MTTDQRTDALRPPYRCGNRSCNLEVPNDGSIPKGWFGLRQYPGDRDLRPLNLGVYHSLACLVAAVEDMLARLEVPA